MTTAFTETDPEIIEHLRNVLEARCLQGECYELAIALNKGAGLKMVGLLYVDVPTHKEVIVHAGVIAPSGKFLDCRGELSEKRFIKPFVSDNDYKIIEIEEKDLRAVRPIRKTSIRTLKRQAEIVWPELPWKDDSYKKRALAFARELEVLSRKHGFWIRGYTPAIQPIISESAGTEKGYGLSVTYDGQEFTVDRKF